MSVEDKDFSVPPVDLQVDPAMAFRILDPELPLALFPVRLEVRFMPTRQPTEIVVRVFPDEIHVDAHDPRLTPVEHSLAKIHWEKIWRGAANPRIVSEAREWLASELGPNRAVYVARATQPTPDPPQRPTPDGKPLTPPLELATVEIQERPEPGRARFLPARWAAFVNVGPDRRGPFWAAHAVTPDLAVTPALTELPDNADAREFLRSQGLAWTFDLDAAERAGMVIRIPIAELPDRPFNGYDSLIVVGASGGSNHNQTFRDLLAAHRYTRGLEFLPPGTATNVTDESPTGAGPSTVQRLFDAEFATGTVDGKGEHRERPGGDPVPTRPDRVIRAPEALPRSLPANALAVACGLPGSTAADLATTASDPAPELALAMNQILWPATWGKYLTDPMRWADNNAPLLASVDMDFLREWFTDFVRTEGPLPTLRVGKQPYGILPVRTLERRDANSNADRMENLLFDIFRNWENPDAVPTLDPDASDTAPDPSDAAEQASDVGAIYGATPHLHEIRLRGVEDTYRELSEEYSLRIGVLGMICALVPKDIVGGEAIIATPEDLDTHPWYQAFATHEADARGAHGVGGQIRALQAMIDDLERIGGYTEQHIAAFRAIKYINRFALHHRTDQGWPPEDSFSSADLLGIVFRHQSRVADAQDYLGADDAIGAVRAPLLYSGGFDTAKIDPITAVLVSTRNDEAGLEAVGSMLRQVRDDVNGGEPDYPPDAEAPLFQHLVQSAATTVAGGERAGSLVAGLDRLIEFVDAGGHDVIPTLERLLRGTLGLAMYRVDAWMTSLSTRRLAEQRVARPTGLQAGGFGWLVNVAPREGRPSQGYIHAPSIDHAVTAAVLRSGWSAFGTAQSGSPLAVDLSSERIRTATALVEGVRSGQELGRLIGARFERRLHDRNLDTSIDDVRKAVLEGTGHGRRPATRIVDGLLLARAYTRGIEQTEVEKAVRTAVDAVIAASGHGVVLQRLVGSAARDLDAVADTLFSQAVHGLLRGDAGVAAPTLAATGSGDSGLPAIDFPSTLRGGRLVTLRVIATFREAIDEAGAWPGTSESILATAEPRLEQWVARLLGPAEGIVFDVDDADDVENAGTIARLDLSVVRLSALDAVYGIDTIQETILDRAGIEGGRVIVDRAADLPPDQLGLGEFIALAGTVRALLGRIRPMTDADFVTDSGGTRTWIVSDLSARLSALRAMLPEDDPRIDTLASHEARNPGATPDLLIARLHILTVHRVPILPLLGDGVPARVCDSFAARRDRSSGPESAAWIAQAAKTRPAVSALTTVGQIAEVVRSTALLDFSVAQSPDPGAGEWIGARAPDGGGGSHLALFSVTGPPEPGVVSGFVIDSWTETIPETRVSTGIAVHFDRPSATAPNAVLMMTTRTGEKFDIESVVDCLKQTLRIAQFRAMGPDQEHVFLGQFLPAVFLPGTANVQTRTASSEDD